MGRVMQLNDGRFLLGQRTLDLDELLGNYAEGDAVVVRLLGGELFVARRVVDLVARRVVAVLGIGANADPRLVDEARLRCRLQLNPEESP